MVRCDGRKRAAALRPHRAGTLRLSGFGRDGSAANLSDAMARYQAENDLVPTGRVDFDLYYPASCKRRPPTRHDPAPRSPRSAASPPPPPAAAPAVAPAAASAAPVEPAPHLTLATTRGGRPAYRVGETITLNLQPTQDAYTYCYYQDGTGSVSRIFPQQFQPDASSRHAV